MKGKIFVWLCVVSSIFLAVQSGFAEKSNSKKAAASQEANTQPSSPTQATEMPADPMDPKMEAWVKASSPGEQHKVLDVFAGNWAYVMKWWQSPESDPEESTGTTENKWILGNRFIKQKVSGTSMGQAFEGISISGYDNIKGEYISVWLDNMMTGIVTSSSQYDSTTKTFTEKGTMACPMTGEKNKPFRGEIRIIDDDHYVYEVHSSDQSGKEFKGLEIHYTRS